MHLDVCKSCGGGLERIGNYHLCKFCGSKWIIDADNDVHVIDRANAWSALRDCDFERAGELFENIIYKEPKNHEAYWGRALANAGIMYVTDYVENKKVPTCNSISESSFIDSRDVKRAIELSPKDIAESYKAQAEQIEAIRVEWVKKASREPAYDVFISYKDSDRENGIERTDDSYDAHELYNALTAEGYKVFFSRVSLRSKVSEHYEPYIYNAIKTAKVMIVFGEKPEYFNAVWIKNEWMRFRKRIELGEKHPNSLVVAYKGIDPADLPVGLRSRQCLDAGSFTFLEDLKRHIAKIKHSNIITQEKNTPLDTSRTAIIDPLHEHKYKDEVIPSTCVAKGYTIHKCDCGYEYRDSYTPLIDHKFKVTKTINPTCTLDGRVEQICEICGEQNKVLTPAVGHQFSKWIEIRHPTCIEDGESQRKCLNCGHVEKHIIPQTGHRYSAWISISTGSQTCNCINCGHTKTRENTSGISVDSEETESKIIPLREIFKNWGLYLTSFFTDKTTKAQKAVHYTGYIFLWSFILLFFTMGMNTTTDDTTTISSPITIISLIVMVFALPVWIGALIARLIEKGRNKAHGIPVPITYSRTWLKFLSGVLVLYSSIFVCLLGNDPSGYPAVMISCIFAIWALITSFLSHCPRKYKDISMGKRVFAKKRFTQIGIAASSVCFIVMVIWISLVPQ